MRRCFRVLYCERYFSSRHLQQWKRSLPKERLSSLGKGVGDVPPTPGYTRYASQLSPASRLAAEPTIFALSTAPGRSAIAIVRISGPACVAIYQGLSHRDEVPKHRHAIIRTLYHPLDRGEILDPGALVLFFPAPRTVTGEDVLELHVHGGTAIVKSILSAIPLANLDSQAIAGSRPIRYAEPGEFTRRAFYNNRLDLTQVEALGDTLSAETEQQRRIAVKGSSAVLARQYEEWRQQLLYARGELEALIDFSEDQHFDDSPTQLITSVAKQIKGLKFLVQTAIKNSFRGELLRKGIDVALLGAPNAGKSSLLNRIVGREAAIVSREAGTTRDVIDIGVDIGGFYCNFGDLAGLRKQSKSYETNVDISTIEQEGMKRARERALMADVVLVIVPIERSPGIDGSRACQIEINDEVASTLKVCSLEKQTIVYVLNKIDLIGSNGTVASMQGLLQRKIADDKLPPSPLPIQAVSCTTDRPTCQTSTVLQGLLPSLTNLFMSMTATSGSDSAAWESSLGATERQRLLLDQCSQDLDVFLDQVKTQSENEEVDNAEVDVVLAAESLRSAADCLSKITGRGEAANVEEVLGVVFEK
ncbi:MAG: hypothetical protein Q9174_002266 [Haloplaca sp. 1 TL-2023]